MAEMAVWVVEMVEVMETVELVEVMVEVVVVVLVVMVEVVEQCRSRCFHGRQRRRAWCRHSTSRCSTKLACFPRVLPRPSSLQSLSTSRCFQY